MCVRLILLIPAGITVAHSFLVERWDFVPLPFLGADIFSALTLFRSCTCCHSCCHVKISSMSGKHCLLVFIVKASCFYSLQLSLL